MTSYIFSLIVGKTKLKKIGAVGLIEGGGVVVFLNRHVSLTREFLFDVFLYNAHSIMPL